jgi:hypothetical protein
MKISKIGLQLSYFSLYSLLNDCGLNFARIANLADRVTNTRG